MAAHIVEKRKKELSSGAVGGIIVGVVLAVTLLIITVYLLSRRPNEARLAMQQRRYHIWSKPNSFSQHRHKKTHGRRHRPGIYINNVQVGFGQGGNGQPGDHGTAGGLGGTGGEGNPGQDGVRGDPTHEVGGAIGTGGTGLGGAVKGPGPGLTADGMEKAGSGIQARAGDGQGGYGTGGTGGPGGMGGTGGMGGIGGHGGQGGQGGSGSAEATAAVSVFAVFVCCTARQKRSRGPRSYGWASGGSDSSMFIGDLPDVRPEPHRPPPAAPQRGGHSGTGGDILVQGGIGHGGVGFGGAGGAGGFGGRGGHGGQAGRGGLGGRGGEGRATADASLHPSLMCCVVIRAPPRKSRGRTVHRISI
ncbi:hypothetical protein VTL71DRAFT_8601 [Oculimacula yallundae]|uniref:Uncharacterized protein n=1 Tax=Oculimacula yallundae TaxID=86028 RepID=A0ABR4CZ23_9HELO